ncbi:MAG: aminotransferase class I/II-fold pyridoxal phosphate-dependent enzyme [Nitrososphaerota archaeon]|nr:aminotransferase class I/II-fold pyridoxal phosphate-dependent enzyme [Candidatus Calditenuaceae archaeon]MDW8074070.1 aminotransferase class I/II-fold pyridoxal phosphate-dependent enzyme [Nitrososphaerota archaeon]
MDEVKRLREEIRAVTEEIIRAVAKRRRLAERLGEAKRRLNVSAIDLDAEAELRAHVTRIAVESGLDTESAHRILSLLIQDAVSIQQPKEKPKITHMDIFRRAKQMEMSGEKIYHLEVGEPDFGAPHQVADTLTWAALHGYAAYGEAKGRPELRKAISGLLREKIGVDISEDQIVVTPGGRFATYLAAAATLKPGDQAVVIDPSWPLYKQVVEMMHARTLILHTNLEEGWRPISEDLEKLVRHNPRAVFINYPNNPTGVTLKPSEIAELVDEARRRDAYLVSDEVYMDYCFTEFTSALQCGYEKTVMINSFSKSWGMTGYRIGYLVASREVADRAARILSQLVTCVPEFIQMAALKATKDMETPRLYGETMKRRLEIVCRELDRIGLKYVKPDGGMYVFPKIGDRGFDSAQFALNLLEKARVAVAPGTAFGDYPEYIRISVGLGEEDLRKGLQLLVKNLGSS